ncbi:MAG: serine--tRNA ligase [Crocinitomicaceae bacterium]|nr:serine--tRNA ligase [Crocinitomicaceae bacterium]|tara:strand:+ start:7916 stop:9196 length:1281 start_codon:yes stop_codon:yes gene_type:complete
MLEINNIRENKESIIGQLKIRNKDFEKLIFEVINLDELRRSAQFKLDNELAELNQLSKKIGELFKTGQHQQANELKQKTALLKDSTKTLKQQLVDSENSIKEILYQIPNVPNKLVPSGNSENDNEVIENYGHTPQLFAGAIPHWEIAKKYNLIDFELGVKITGSGFPVYIGKGAQLQRALINFFLNEAIASNYKEVIPPLVVNEESGFATGQLPDKEGQMYHMQEDNLYLIPTAEVPITNIFRNTLLKEDDFPVKRVGYTPCFRREAGSYGKDVRGLNRLHQFDKVEIVQLAHPENSYAILDEMVAHVKLLLDKLELPYRVVRLCGGDLGFTAALTYDFEVYSSAQQKWLEVSSVSNFETYQSNRLKLRFKNNNNKNQLVHTLNGSALALPRIMAALLENNQSEKGISIPKVLIPYTGFDTINDKE